MSRAPRALAAALGLCAALGPMSAPLHAVDFADEMQPRAETALKRGLDFLARTQRPDGSWSGWGGPSTGIVAACMLGFLGAGQVPGSGEHGPVVAKAIDYLIKTAQPTGLIYRPEMGAYPMYHHGLATLALAEAWGQSEDPRIRDVLKRAVDLICNCQNQKGGWRYNPVISDDDLSVTVMQLMALRAAKDAGLDVPKDVIDAGIEYVKSCHNGKGQGRDGGFSYTPGSDSGFARTGAGVTSLQVAGNYKATEVSEGVEYILRFKPLGTADPGGFYYYGLYYTTMGIYQAQGIGLAGRKAWAQWYPAVVNSLVSTQTGEGKWDGEYDPFPTAMANLILTIPCRYLPVYQR
jgi:prenyltransferase beta subunit